MGRSMQRGASAIEFALSLPFILVLVFGATDFALWSFTRQAVSRSVQDGAREASTLTLPVDATDGSLIEDTAKDAVVAALDMWGLDGAAANVETEWQTDAAGIVWLTVTATVDYASPFGPRSPFSGVPVRRRFVVFTQEQDPP